MENVGSIDYVARIDTRQLRKDSDEADSLARRAGDSIGDNTERGSGKASTALASLGGIAKNTALVIGATLTAGVVAATRASWNQVSAVQASGATLNSYIGDATKVTQIQKDLIKFAQSDLGVLFNRKDLFESASGLAQLNIQAEKIPGYVKIASRAVATNRTDWTNLNDAIADVLSTGEIAGPTFDRLQRSGFKLDNSLRNAAITSEEFFKALDVGIPESVSQDMENIIPLSIRFESAFRAVGDAILGVNEIGDGFTAGSLGQQLINGIKSFTEFLRREEIRSSLREIGTTIASTFTIARTAFMSFFNAFQPAIDYVRSNQKLWETLKLTLMAIGAVVLSLAVGIGIVLVGAFVAVSAAVEVAAWLMEAIINAVFAFGQGIGNIIGTVAAFGTITGQVFSNAVGFIKSTFSSLFGFFQGLWSNIIGLFSSVGTAVGNAIGATFKNVINSVLRGAANLINGFINAINGAVETINKIPGVKLNKLGTLPIPALAAGGIVSSPTLAMIGEGRESEAVLPLSKLDDMLSEGASSRSGGSEIKIELNMSGIMTRSKSDMRAVASDLIESLNEQLRARQLDEIGGGNLRRGIA